MSQLAFLDYLKLDDSADERAIRRAYAGQLKLIDQEADAAGFQALREAYEVALQWARWQKQQAAQPAADAGEAPAEPDASPAGAETGAIPAGEAVTASAASSASESAAEVEAATEATSASGPVPLPVAGDLLLEALPPEEAARAVFNGLLADLASSASASGWSSDQLHYAGLLRCLDDSRLLPIAARDIFEWYIAELLASGWRPGQEALLVAATRVFAWQDDARRLLRFGWVGDVLNRAIIERAAFDQQGEAARKTQRDLIARLRDPATPSQGELIAKMAELESTLSRFPNWLPLITSMENLRQWRELDQQVPNWRRRLSPRKNRATVPTAATEAFNPRWLIILLVVITIRLVGSLSGNNAPSPVAAGEVPGGAAFSYASSAADAFRANNPKPPESVPLPPSREQLAALVNGQPTLGKCDELARLTQLFKLGTGQAQSRFSPAFERQVINCANARLWPRSVYQDPAVQEAAQHEEQRSAADMKSLQRKMDKQVRVGPPAEKPPGLPAPEKPAKPARDPGLTGVLVPSPNFRPVEPYGSLKADTYRQPLNATGVQLDAKD